MEYSAIPYSSLFPTHIWESKEILVIYELFARDEYSKGLKPVLDGRLPEELVHRRKRYSPDSESQ